MNEAATKQDLKDAISELKIYIVERENNWLKWIVGFQLSYFAVVIGVVYFAVAHIR